MTPRCRKACGRLRTRSGLTCRAGRCRRSRFPSILYRGPVSTVSTIGGAMGWGCLPMKMMTGAERVVLRGDRIILITMHDGGRVRRAHGVDVHLGSVRVRSRPLGCWCASSASPIFWRWTATTTVLFCVMMGRLIDVVAGFAIGIRIALRPDPRRPQLILQALGRRKQRLLLEQRLLLGCVTCCCRRKASRASPGSRRAGL